MRYLKTFEKQTEEDRDIASVKGQANSDYLQSLIDEYLAYIIDDGFKAISSYVYYDRPAREGSYYNIHLFKGPPFDIEDIYDDLLSFIEVVDTKGYGLLDCEVSLVGMKAGDDYLYSAEDVINRKIDNFQIRYIDLNFRKK